MTNPHIREPRAQARLSLDISLSPDYVGGTLMDENGMATAFEGWLGLARAVATAAADGSDTGPSISGPPLLGDGEKAASRR